MSTRTVFLSKLIGLYCLILSITMMLRRAETVAAIDAMTRSAPLLLILGVAALVGGLALVIGHNVWHGAAAAVLVTLVGWILLAKSLMLLLLSPAGEAAFLADAHYAQLFYLYMCVDLLLGAYLTYAGFVGTPRAEQRQTGQIGSAAHGLPNG